VPAPDKAPSVITRFFAAVRGLVTIRTPHRGSDRVGSRLRVSVIFQKKNIFGFSPHTSPKGGLRPRRGIVRGGRGLTFCCLEVRVTKKLYNVKTRSGGQGEEINISCTAKSSMIELETLPRDAMHKRGLCRLVVSVLMSVCLSSHVRGFSQNE